ncbi:MAG TPA: nuclear transport factor 2 family protein [Flavisolibacter sp.]
MRKLPLLLMTVVIVFACNSKNSETTASSSEGFNVSASDQKDLADAEKKMFIEIIKGGDYWNTDVDDDYITINADGVMADKKETMTQNANRDTTKPNPFAMVTETKTSDRKVRKYGDLAIITGKAEFMGGTNKLAEVYYTEIWRKKNNKWLFDGWQGTMTKHMQQMMMKQPPK